MDRAEAIHRLTRAHNFVQTVNQTADGISMDLLSESPVPQMIRILRDVLAMADSLGTTEWSHAQDPDHWIFVQGLLEDAEGMLTWRQVKDRGVAAERALNMALAVLRGDDSDTSAPTSDARVRRRVITQRISRRAPDGRDHRT